MNKKLMCVLAVALLCAVMATPLFAGGQTDKGAAKTGEIQGNLRILYPGTSDIEKEIALDIERITKQKYPKINFEFMFLVWADIEKKMAVMVQAKDYPDLMQVQDVVNAVAMDALEPLDDWMKKSGLTADKFYAAPLDYMKVNGVTYAVPGTAVAYAHTFNTDLLKGAGYSLDKLNTWDDVKAAVKAMTKDGVSGYAMANGGEGRFAFRDFMMVCLSNDVNPDDVSPASKAKYLEVLTFFNDLAPSMPESQVTWLYPELFKAWEAGKVGIIHTGSYFTANLVPHGVTAMPKTTAVAFPKGPSAKDRKAMVGACGYAMFKGSTQKEAAWKAVETIFSTEVLGKWAGSLGLPAAKYITSDIMSTWAQKIYPSCAADHVRLMGEFSSAIDKYGVAMPKIVGQKAMEKVVQGSLVKMMSKQITPEQAYEEIKTGIEQVKSSLK